MLPLDALSDAAAQALASSGVDPASPDMCLRLDLDMQGNFGEVFLLYAGASGRLFRVAGTRVESFPLGELTEPYIDNYVTSNRLQAHRHAPDDRPPERGDLTEAAYGEAVRAYRSSGDTIVLGHCTNACKLHLLAFVSLWERLERGEEIAPDDAVFKQFERKDRPRPRRRGRSAGGDEADGPQREKGILRRLLPYFTVFKKQLAIILLCLLGNTALTLLNPIVSGRILYDRVIDPAGPMHQLKYVYLWVGVLVLMAILSVCIGIVQNRVNAYLSTRVTRNLKNDIFRALQRLSLSYFNRNPTGTLYSRVNYDADRVRNFFIGSVPSLIVNLLSYAVMTVLLFLINWKLTLIMYLPVIPVVLILKFALPRFWRCCSRQWRRSSALNAMMNDSLSGIRVVKAFAKEDAETRRFYDCSTRLYEANLHTQMVSMCIFPIISILIGASCHAMWGFTGMEVIGKRMSYGELMTYIGYTGLVFGPLSFFTNFTSVLTDTMNSAVRMFEVLDMVPEVTEAADPVRLEKVRGEIRFDHVSFHYNPNRPVLKDVSFTVHAGDHVGIVGHTGSGKSTIANLITRMYDVTGGAISIDGTDIRRIETASLRRNVAIVSQEVYIFRGTVMDNIRYAKPEASRDEVIAAAEAANAHDFIMRLPEGYETMVGIGSRSLSGGERQRVSIARALLLDPSLLILDEATAAMDTETERLIAEAIDRVSAGKTTLSIAHRLSSLRNCNYLMAIENGTLAEIGTAEELLALKGVYYRLWTLQHEQMQKVMVGR